ncbi:uncharacterized protein LOC118647442 [Monomorium pharaonis]|uniref:uncharacterized protein LOC118647442 n=1 Tax=Monomorium pharaonis TaxID=307658 RepID=UPI0017472723|nr:uncharacterized protein LOC118647442 [Monomorium pharaonis]
MVSLTRLELYKVIEDVQPSSRFEFLRSFILNKLGLSECLPSIEKDLNNSIHLFLNKITQKKLKLRKSSDEFIKKSRSWLDKEFIIPNSLLSFRKNKMNITESACSGKRGRPKVPFEDASERTKRRHCSELLSSYSVEQVASAATRTLRKDDKRQVAHFVNNIISSGSIPKQPEKPENRQYSEDQALSLLIRGKLTKSQYNLIRLGAKEMGSDLYPSYKRILEAKKQCYPNGITVTDDSAEVSLQSLLNHTASRLLQTCETVLISLGTSVQKLELIVKWGFDGSSGQSQYKQNASSGLKSSDHNLFATWLVPLQLRYTFPNGNMAILWSNPRSVRYSRPLRFQFLKETATVIRTEEEYVTSQITKLLPLKLEQPFEIMVNFKMVLTMADGKVWNALKDTSSMMCYICKATSKNLKQLDLSNRCIDESALSFGISPLHCLIRYFECLIHIAYRIPLKKWRITGIDKIEFEKQKKCIQDQLRQRLGLIVDMPKQGSGNTNDGNSARRFFENPVVSSQITGVDKDLVVRFSTLLKAISSGFEIDSIKFGKYCKETADLYRKVYNWYPMPPTVHKLLDHGEMIVSSAILPIGQLSEEAQEARNKDCRYFREHHTRKRSRVATNEDLFKRLLASSDPYITSLRRMLPKKSSTISADVLNLLKQPDIINQEDESDDDNNDDDD